MPAVLLYSSCQYFSIYLRLSDIIHDILIALFLASADSY